MGRYDWQIVIGFLAFIGALVLLAMGVSMLLMVGIIEIWFR